MNKTLRLYIAFLVLIFIGIVFIDANKPIPINWSPTFDVKDKIPFGLYVFNNEFPSIVKPKSITKITKSPYEFLESQYDYDTLVNNYKISGTFLAINETDNIDTESSIELFNFVSRGNTVFLSMKDFPIKILDSLNLETTGDFQFSDSIFCWMANPKFGKKRFNLLKDVGNNYFSKIDTLNTTVLGYQTGDSTRVNFIKVPFKTGNFFLHTQPTAFSNYYMLKKGYSNYAENILSYLPKQNVYWYLKDKNGEEISSSPFRYILSQRPLKWAWYLFLGGTLLFMIFNAKRRQRTVPIIKPLENTTVDFAKTIGNLYFQEADHSNMIDKKIVYFLEKLRQDYLMDTSILDEKFIKRLQQKTGKDFHVIEETINLINQHRKKIHEPIESDLLRLNR
jgi:hypothetical protein